MDDDSSSKIILLFVLLMLCVTYVYPQENTSSFLHGTDWLEAPEAKKWNKSLKGLDDADKLLNQSNEKYLEIGNIQSKEELNEKDNKQIAKLQNEADDLAIKSLESYKKVYLELNKIISDKFNDQSYSHPSYSSWQDFSDQASMLYSEANDLESFEKASKLTQANEKQIQGLKKGIEVFTLGESSAGDAGASSVDDYPDEDFVINKELLRKYREYIENDNIPPPVTAAELIEKQISDADASYMTFAQVWNDYQQGNLEKVNESLRGVDETLSGQNLAYSDSSGQPSEGKVDGVSLSDSPDAGISSGTIQDQDETTSGGTATTAESSFYPTGTSEEELEFRVQIAASRIPMNISQIESIYSGDRAVVEILEEDYFKYQIRGYMLLTDAQAACSQSDVENAYIEAYREKKRIALGLAAKENKNLEQMVSQKGRERSLSQILFSVELTASRTRLSEQQVQNLTNCTNPIFTVFEGGWYKYQVFIGKHLESALDFLEKCAGEKSFVVAYKNGRKLKLHKAIQEYKTNMP